MIVKFLFYILAGLGILFFYIKYLETKCIFFPDKNVGLTPAAAGLSFEDVYIEADDNLKLNGWFIRQPGARKTVLFLPGNAGNIANRLDKLVLIGKAETNIFIIDYRGYGKSQGKPTEPGIYLDAQAAYNYLINQLSIKPEDIVLYGESLGGAVAIDLASKRKTGGLILEGVFSSGRDIGHHRYPFLPKFMLPNLFDSLSKIKAIKAPKLFIHSEADEVVPFSLGKKLYDSSPGSKKFIKTTGLHNSIFIDDQETYIKAVINFIKELGL